MQKIINKTISQLTLKLETTAFLASTIFLFSSLFIPNVKFFFVLAFLYFGYLTFECGFAKAIIYSLPIFGLINFGQNHQILVVPPGAITSPQYLTGRHLSWSISPHLIILTVASIIFYFWQKKQKFRIVLSNLEKMLIITLSSGFLSALYGAIIPELSLYSAGSSLIGISWVFYAISLKKNSSSKDWQKIVLTLMAIISLTICFEALIVIGQMLFRNNIGLFIEGTQMAPVFGLGADENSGSFRPFGLSGHPNGLASHQLLLLISVNLIGSYLNIKDKNWQNILVGINLIVFVIIILTLSRAAYLALFFSLGFFFVRHPRYFQVSHQFFSKQLKKLRPRHILVLFIFSGLLLYKVADRLMSSMYVMSKTGGISTRLVQYQEAWQVFLHSPFWGIGNEMFIPTSYQLFPQGVMTYFPENVHNGLLLLLIEKGSLGFLLQFIFIIIFLKTIRQSSLSKISQTLLYSSLITSAVIMMFHPVQNSLSLGTLLGLVFLHTNYEKNNSN